MTYDLLAQQRFHGSHEIMRGDDAFIEIPGGKGCSGGLSSGAPELGPASDRRRRGTGPLSRPAGEDWGARGPIRFRAGGIADRDWHPPSTWRDKALLNWIREPLSRSRWIEEHFRDLAFAA